MADPYEIQVVGGKRTPLRDFYHAMLRLSWPMTIACIVTAWLAVNALFALVYLVVGGIDHAREGSFLDAFFFSVQTMGTIGYGAMSPQSVAANTVVVIESISSLLVTALSTGLVFAKFSRPTARMMFSNNVTIGPMNGVPTLAFRVGNERANRIVNARINVVFVRTETTLEGTTFYRNVDLPLQRSTNLTLARAWTVLHTIDDKSPLAGETPESLAKLDAEILVTITGTDDIWMQTVHASHQYFHDDILWNKRLADVLSEDGRNMTLDLQKFHTIESID